MSTRKTKTSFGKFVKHLKNIQKVEIKPTSFQLIHSLTSFDFDIIFIVF
jgi:hypothetical protein